MREQCEACTQALVDQLRAKAVLTLPGNRRYRREWWKSWTKRVVHMKSMHVPDPEVSQGAIERVEQAYIARHFTPKARVEEELEGMRRRVEKPVRRYREL